MSSFNFNSYMETSLLGNYGMETKSYEWQSNSSVGL